MTKQLLIMRHAKSSWTDINATDHERKLNRRGLRDAPRMGQFVHQENCVPDLILCSTATRAQATAELFIENCEGIDDSQLVLVDEFYHASPRIYLSRLAELGNDEIETAMVIGHNPGLEELVLRLGDRYESMPTAAIAHLQLEIESWSKITNRPTATLQAVWRPKEM